jgi:hypothetical protein
MIPVVTRVLVIATGVFRRIPLEIPVERGRPRGRQQARFG